MFIDESFFIGEINLPNTSSAEAIENIVLFVQHYEKSCLEGLLGYELAKLFMAEQTSERMANIYNGVEYTDSNDRIVKWKGIVYKGVPDTNKFSLLANYIYYMIMHDKAIWNSGIGTVVPKGDTVIVTPPTFKINWAYNQFAREGRCLWHFLNQNKDVYPEWDSVTSYEAYKFTRTINDFDL